MPRIITVKGTGRVSTKPDFVEISMKLEAKDKEYDKAMEEAAKQLEALKDSLASIGYQKDDLKTTSFDVDTEYDSYNDKEGNYRRKFSGFVCRHRLKLSFDFDMQSLSQALSTIATCVARPEFSIAFTIKDANAVSEEVLRKATSDAKRKAELLCDASGVELGKLITIDYNWGELNVYSDTSYDMGREYSLEAPRMVNAIEIEPDDIDVKDTAAFVWEIE